ncbi:MAG: glycosyltransferase family 4 protein [Cyclobacteriaceae bacterium]
MRSKGCPVEEYLYQNKSGLLIIFLKVLFSLVKKRPDVIHTHLLEANVIGLTSAWIIGIKKRIFTRHHALVHYDDYPRGIIWDKWCNLIATDIIAVSNTVKKILIEKDRADPKKISVIHHGFDIDYFRNVSPKKINHLKRKHTLEQVSPVIGVIARHVQWKGIQYIIPAFEKLLKKYPNAKLVLANAQGDYSSKIDKLLKGIPNNNYCKIIFEEDISTLYHCFDIYVHVPIDDQSEAFGQGYIESLASGVPSVVTLSGIANDAIQHGHNALVVAHQNSDEIFHAVMKVLENPGIAQKIVQNGYKTASQNFQVGKMISSLEKMYEN